MGGVEESGYDILKWAFTAGFVPPRVNLVTRTPVGGGNMGNLLKDAGYNSKDGRNFYKD